MPPSRHHPRRPASAVSSRGFLGQVLVACCNVAFLPAMEHWYSGLLPYPILLPVQLVMIVIMSKLVWGRLSRRRFLRTAERAVGARAVVGQRGLFFVDGRAVRRNDDTPSGIPMVRPYHPDLVPYGVGRLPLFL